MGKLSANTSKTCSHAGAVHLYPNQVVSQIYPKTLKPNTKMILKSTIKPLIDSFKINSKSDAFFFFEIYYYKYQNYSDFGPHFVPTCLIFSRGKAFWGRPVFGNLCKPPLGPIWTSRRPPEERF